MLANGRGFLHDLDYAFNWKAFLYVNGFEDTMASWQEYVRTSGTGIPRQDAGNGEQPTVPPNEPAPAAEGRVAPPVPVLNKAGHKEYFVDAILAERRVSGRGRRKEFLVQWKGYQECSWEPAKNLCRCEAFLQWKTRTVEERADLSRQHDAGVPAADERPETGSADDTLRDQRGRPECKERTVIRP